MSKNKDFLNMCLSLQYNHNFQFHLINFISFWSLSLKFQGEILECNFPESSYFLTCKFIYPLVTLTRLLEVETFDVFLASSNRFLLQSCIVHKKLISKLQTIGNGLITYSLNPRKLFRSIIAALRMSSTSSFRHHTLKLSVFINHSTVNSSFIDFCFHWKIVSYD